MEIFFSLCIFLYLRKILNQELLLVLQNNSLFKISSKILKNGKEKGEVRRKANDSSLECNLMLG